ncbi:MAG: late competence development ComFB family protein [Spirochaetota bacterium]|nr:late competence development ComFB family protein [Spirochaetota bacterium]
MILRNNMEDFVLNVVNEMLKDSKDNFWQNDAHRHDLACYVLNRVKPRYVTSGRGILHSEIILEKNIQENVDIFSLVAEGMRVISSRRTESDRNADNKDDYDETEDFYFNFPYFLGKVISMNTWEELSGVIVTLKHKVDDNFVISPMINSQWLNPYTISEETSGYYTFFPHHIKDEKLKSTSKTFQFMLHFEHPKIEPFERHFSIDSTSERGIPSIFQRGLIHRIDDVYINV